MASEYPGALDTLWQIGNFKETILTQALTQVATIIPVQDASTWPIKGIVKVDNELIMYSEKTNTQLGSIGKPCVRGYDGSPALAHDSNKAVKMTFVAAHYNDLRDAVVAMETAMGTNIKGKYTDLKARIIALEIQAFGSSKQV